MLPCKFPVARCAAHKRMISLLGVTTAKYGDLLNIKTTYYQQHDDAPQRVKTTLVNFRTVLEALLHEYVVSNIDGMLCSKRDSLAWSKYANNLDASLEKLGAFLSTGFAYKKESLTVDAVAERVCALVQCHLGISLDEQLVHMHVCSICQICGGSELLVGSFCRSTLMMELIGKRLPYRLFQLIHCEDFGIAPPTFAADITNQLHQDVTELRKEVIMLRASLRSNLVRSVVTDVLDNDQDDESETGAMLANMFANQGASEMRLKTDALAAILRNNIAFRNAPSALTDAINWFQLASDVALDAASTDLTKLLSKNTMISHMFVLEEALDELMKEEIFKVLPTSPITSVV